VHHFRRLKGPSRRSRKDDESVGGEAYEPIPGLVGGESRDRNLGSVGIIPVAQNSICDKRN